MSFSICIIGNSHIAAVKQAWSNRKPELRPDVSLEFFSASTSLLAGLELDGTTLRCGHEELREKIVYTSGGQDCIELARYNAFVVIGSGFGLDIPKFSKDLDIVSGSREPEAALVSRPCFVTVIAGWLEESYAVSIIGTIRSVSAAPVVLCAAPHLTERVLTDEEELRAQKRFHDPEFLKFAVDAAKAAGEKISARLGTTLIWQDEETVGVPGFTKASYGLNPVRFTMQGGGKREVDRKHGNEDYGFIMLGAILRKLDELSGGQVLPAQRKPRAKK